MIDMMPINSENIFKIGYDQDNSSLHIQYNDNSLYEYYNVELDIFTNLLFSSSKAEFIKENICDKFSCNKVA